MRPDSTQLRATDGRRDCEAKSGMTMGALILFTTLFLPAAAIATNLVTNGGFDTEIFAWELRITSLDHAEWSTADAGGLASSGSASVTRTIDHIAPNITALTQCLPVEAGRAHDFESKIFVPTGQSGDLEAFSGVQWYASEDCASGSYIDATNAGLVVEVGTWIRNEEDDVIAPPGAVGALIVLSVFGPAGDEYTAHFDDVVLEADAGAITCVNSFNSLCLNQGRFQVVMSWRTEGGETGIGQGVQLTADSGYFWFFNNDNVEVVIKVLDGCAINDRYWVFAAGLTNVEAEITVTDTELGASVTYVNTLGSVFVPVLDIDAFATCP